MIDVSNIEKVIEGCFNELSVASKEKYEAEKAEKTAAMFLAAQMQLAMLVSDSELKAKHSKNDIERIEASKYYALRISDNNGKKMTESALSQLIAKDEDVIQAKNAWAQAEAELKKYSFIMNSLRDGHIFFRTIGKGKNIWND